MKATGIVRRIDDLGRIVIPKEIRKTLKIHEGSPLEIFTDSQGNVIFKKYSPVGEIEELVQIYAQVLSSVLSCDCVITDTDKVIAAFGSSKKDILEKNISEELREFISQRKILITKDSIKVAETLDRHSDFVSMIVSGADPIGTIVLSNVENKDSSELIKILKMISVLIGKQTE